MRAKTEPSFCNYLMQIGNRTEKQNVNQKIKIPQSLLIPFTIEKEPLHTLFNVTYLNIQMLFTDTNNYNSRVILTTKNDYVNEINKCS